MHAKFRAPIFVRRWEIRNRTNKQTNKHSKLNTAIIPYGGIKTVTPLSFISSCENLRAMKFLFRSSISMLGSGRENSVLHSGQARLRCCSFWLLQASMHLKQNTCPHGSTRGSVYTSVQIEHSVTSSSFFAVAIFLHAENSDVVLLPAE